MADDVVKDDRPTAQVFRLVEFGNSRTAQVQKDLGPNGGQTPLGAVQPNAFEPEDEYQQLYVGATRASFSRLTICDSSIGSARRTTRSVPASRPW
jgi:hypothetical protein